MTIPTSGYIKISATGKLEIIDAATVTDTTRFINQTVEGWFDVVRTDGPIDFWLNDEGIYTHSVNPVATEIIRTWLGTTTQMFYGPVLIARHDNEGETLPLTPEDMEHIISVHGEVGD